MHRGRSKHDAGCLRRKVEMDMPYVCTCDMTDDAVEQANKRRLETLLSTSGGPDSNFDGADIKP